MPKLLLVKHSNSNHNPDQPPHEWGLTPEGITRAKVLINYIVPYQPKRLFASPMVKARHTAELVSEQFNNIPIIENPNLAEHSRKSNAPYTTLQAFHDNLRCFFENPNELMFGDETASQAQERFSQGITEVIQQAPPDEHVIVVAHGTVNSLFTAQHNDIDVYDLWLRLKLPSVVILDLSSFELVDVIEDAGILP